MALAGCQKKAFAHQSFPYTVMLQCGKHNVCFKVRFKLCYDNVTPKRTSLNGYDRDLQHFLLLARYVPNVA